MISDGHQATRNLTYEGEIEIPILQPTESIPNRLISFSKAMKTDDFDQWVHFYEYDRGFERIWNRPNYYLEKLKKFKGVVTPDFSLYRDMPLVMQQWNTYRGKALGHWWQTKDLTVLPNVRFSDEHSFEFCCYGVPMHCPIAVGTHGCLRIREERELYKRGLEAIVQRLKPSYIIVYGAAPEDIFSCCLEANIPILQFDSEFARSRKEAPV